MIGGHILRRLMWENIDGWGSAVPIMTVAAAVRFSTPSLLIDPLRYFCHVAATAKNVADLLFCFPRRDPPLHALPGAIGSSVSRTQLVLRSWERSGSSSRLYGSEFRTTQPAAFLKEEVPKGIFPHSCCPARPA